MGLLDRFRKPRPSAAPDHSVIVHYSLSDEEFGSVEEREEVFALEDRLVAIIDKHGLGELDGNEFGAGEAVLHCYGPDADRLFTWIEGELRAFPARPAYAVLRYGPYDAQAAERRVEL